MLGQPGIQLQTTLSATCKLLMGSAMHTKLSAVGRDLACAVVLANKAMSSNPGFTCCFRAFTPGNCALWPSTQPAIHHAMIRSHGLDCSMAWCNNESVTFEANWALRLWKRQ